MKRFLQLCMFLIFFGLSTADEGPENHRKGITCFTLHSGIVVPTKSDSYVVFCVQLLSKTFTCTLDLS